MERLTQRDIERFEKFFTKEHGCWIWKGSLRGNNGYGQFGLKGNGNNYAHRVSYFLYKGRIPKGMLVCHTCDIPACVNPEHLWLGDKKANARDALSKGRIPILKGDEAPHRKLTSSDVVYIRELYKEGNHTYLELADHYDVSGTLISKIVHKKLW